MARSTKVEAYEISDYLDGVTSELRYWALRPGLLAAYPQHAEELHTSAVEKAMSAADGVNFMIQQRIYELDLVKKVSIEAKLDELTVTLKPLKSVTFLKCLRVTNTAQASVSKGVTSVINELKKDIDAVVASQLTSQQQVGQVQNEITKSWKELNTVVRNAHMEIVQGIISNLKSDATSLTLVEPELADEMPTVAKLISDFSSRIVKNIEKVDISGLVPDLEALNLHVDASSVPNDRLSYTWTRQFQVQAEKAIAKTSKSVKGSMIVLALKGVMTKTELTNALKKSKEAVANAQVKYKALTTLSTTSLVDIIQSFNFQCCST